MEEQLRSSRSDAESSSLTKASVGYGGGNAFRTQPSQQTTVAMMDDDDDDGGMSDDEDRYELPLTIRQMVVFSVVIANYIFVFGVHTCYGFLYLHFLEQFQMGKLLTALMGSLSYGIAILLIPFVARPYKGINYWIFNLIGNSMMAIGLWSMTYVMDFYFVFCFYTILFGIGSSFSVGPCKAIISLLPRRHKKKIVIIVLLLSGLSTFIFVQIFYWSDHGFGWQYTVRGLALASSFLALLSLCFRSIKRTEKKLDITDPDYYRLTPRNTLWLWKTKVFFMWAVVHCTISFCSFLPFTTVGDHVDEVSGSLFKYVVLMTLFSISTTVGRAMMLEEWEIEITNRRFILQTILIATSSCMILLPFASKYFSLLTVYMMLAGLLDASITCLLPSISNSIFGFDFAEIGTLHLSYACFIPIVVGPVLAAVSREEYGSYSLMFQMSGCLLALSTILICWLPEDELQFELNEMWYDQTHGYPVPHLRKLRAVGDNLMSKKKSPQVEVVRQSRASIGDQPYPNATPLPGAIWEDSRVTEGGDETHALHILTTHRSTPSAKSYVCTIQHNITTETHVQFLGKHWNSCIDGPQVNNLPQPSLNPSPANTLNFPEPRLPHMECGSPLLPLQHSPNFRFNEINTEGEDNLKIGSLEAENERQMDIDESGDTSLSPSPSITCKNQFTHYHTIMEDRNREGKFSLKSSSSDAAIDVFVVKTQPSFSSNRSSVSEGNTLLKESMSSDSGVAHKRALQTESLLHTKTACSSNTQLTKPVTQYNSEKGSENPSSEESLLKNHIELQERRPMSQDSILTSKPTSVEGKRPISSEDVQSYQPLLKTTKWPLISEYSQIQQQLRPVSSDNIQLKQFVIQQQMLSISTDNVENKNISLQEAKRPASSDNIEYKERPLKRDWQLVTNGIVSFQSENISESYDFNKMSSENVQTSQQTYLENDEDLLVSNIKVTELSPLIVKIPIPLCTNSSQPMATWSENIEIDQPAVVYDDAITAKQYSAYQIDYQKPSDKDVGKESFESLQPRATAGSESSLDAASLNADSSSVGGSESLHATNSGRLTTGTTSSTSTIKSLGREAGSSELRSNAIADTSCKKDATSKKSNFRSSLEMLDSKPPQHPQRSSLHKRSGSFSTADAYMHYTRRGTNGTQCQYSSESSLNWFMPFTDSDKQGGSKEDPNLSFIVPNASRRPKSANTALRSRRRIEIPRLTTSQSTDTNSVPQSTIYFPNLRKSPASNTQSLSSMENLSSPQIQSTPDAKATSNFTQDNVPVSIEEENVEQLKSSSSDDVQILANRGSFPFNPTVTPASSSAESDKQERDSNDQQIKQQREPELQLTKDVNISPTKDKEIAEMQPTSGNPKEANGLIVVLVQPATDETQRNNDSENVGSQKSSAENIDVYVSEETPSTLAVDNGFEVGPLPRKASSSRESNIVASKRPSGTKTPISGDDTAEEGESLSLLSSRDSLERSEASNRKPQGSEKSLNKQDATNSQPPDRGSPLTLFGATSKNKPPISPSLRLRQTSSQESFQRRERSKQLLENMQRSQSYSKEMNTVGVPFGQKSFEIPGPSQNKKLTLNEEALAKHLAESGRFSPFKLRGSIGKSHLETLGTDHFDVTKDRSPYNVQEDNSDELTFADSLETQNDNDLRELEKLTKELSLWSASQAQESTSSTTEIKMNLVEKTQSAPTKTLWETENIEKPTPRSVSESIIAESKWKFVSEATAKEANEAIGSLSDKKPVHSDVSRCSTAAQAIEELDDSRRVLGYLNSNIQIRSGSKLRTMSPGQENREASGVSPTPSNREVTKADGNYSYLHLEKEGFNMDQLNTSSGMPFAIGRNKSDISLMPERRVRAEASKAKSLEAMEHLAVNGGLLRATTAAKPRKRRVSYTKSRSDITLVPTPSDTSFPTAPPPTAKTSVASVRSYREVRRLPSENASVATYHSDTRLKHDQKVLDMKFRLSEKLNEHCQQQMLKGDTGSDSNQDISGDERRNEKPYYQVGEWLYRVGDARDQLEEGVNEPHSPSESVTPRAFIANENPPDNLFLDEAFSVSPSSRHHSSEGEDRVKEPAITPIHKVTPPYTHLTRLIFVSPAQNTSPDFRPPSPSAVDYANFVLSRPLYTGTNIEEDVDNVPVSGSSSPDRRVQYQSTPSTPESPPGAYGYDRRKELSFVDTSTENPNAENDLTFVIPFSEADISPIEELESFSSTSDASHRHRSSNSSGQHSPSKNRRRKKRRKMKSIW